jgi:hypothetical protein
MWDALCDERRGRRLQLLLAREREEEEKENDEVGRDIILREGE